MIFQASLMINACTCLREVQQFRQTEAIFQLDKKQNALPVFPITLSDIISLFSTPNRQKDLEWYLREQNWRSETSLRGPFTQDSNIESPLRKPS